MSINKIIVYAPNVYHGGGIELLGALFDVNISELEITFVLDVRYVLKRRLKQNQKVMWVKPGVFNRLKQEFFLRKTLNKSVLLLCFSGMPPFFSNSATTCLFVQNILLLKKINQSDESLAKLSRFWIKRVLFKCFVKNVDRVVVQTETMKQSFHTCIKVKRPVIVCPFVINEILTLLESKQISDKMHYQFDFIYPTTRVAHKNYVRLVEAWVLLAQQGLYPSLCLTLDPSDTCETVLRTVQLQKQHKLNIHFVGFLNKGELDKKYAATRACIYPSLDESFGLPLIEARSRGLSVLAGELDYVRDVLDPDETFQPYSERSIARAVTRFLQSPRPLNCFNVELKGPSEFIQALLAK